MQKMNVSPTSEFAISPIGAAWAKGWTLTRNKPAPVQQSYGCKIDLGLPDHLERHVVIDHDAATLRDLVDSLQIPGTWLKVCAHPDHVIPLLREHWQVQAPEYLMAVALSDTGVGAHDGYRLSISTSGAVSEAECRDINGELAAKGRVAHCDGIATFDQIVTEPTHQRKGLGRVIMAALGKHSIARGAKAGVLVATEQGRALYEAIGWTLVSPVTAAVIT